MNLFFRKKIFLLSFLFGLVLLFSFSFFPLLRSDSAQSGVLIRLKEREQIYRLSSPAFLSSSLSKIASFLPFVEYAEPNYSFEASFVPDDLLYRNQWYLSQIKAPQAWDFTKGGSEDIVIAILDTGVDVDHPDLQENIWHNSGEIPGDGIDNDDNGFIDDVYGWDFIRYNSNPRPRFDEPYGEGGIHHGTLVAGIASAVGDNQQGIAGVAWKSKIMPLRVLNSQGTGSVENVIRAVRYAVQNGAKIINLSFVGTNESFFLAEALKEAWRQGVIVVAAAGNETVNQPLNLNKTPNYPICLDQEDDDNFIVGVTAVDDTDRKALFSDFGRKCVDIAAPGTKIYGTLAYNSSDKDYREYYGGYWSGTSLAAPMVSGLAALIWSINPLFSQKQVQDFIFSQADGIDNLNPGLEGELGQGRINAYRSVDYAYSQLGTLDQSYYIVTGAGAGGGPHVRIFDSAGLSLGGFFAYDENFRGGVQVSAGDIKGEGKDYIVTGAGAGGGPHVRIFDLNGEPQGGFFAYDENFRGGVQVAVGDVDGDGQDEIITAPGPNQDSLIKIFNWQGEVKAEFPAYNKNFQGRVNLGIGDINGNGRKEIITGAGAGGGPHVRIFNSQGGVLSHFFAFNRNFLGGVQVAVGDVDGDGIGEIICSVDSRASSYVRVFDSRLLLLRLQFLSYSKDYYQGANLATADFDQDKRSEIIIAPNKFKEPEINIFDSSGDPVSRFYAYSRNFLGGVNVTTMRAYDQ
ncbi:S8 family serine peptidase [Patescibacteria group bacterium]|nr:S8 family serine peptidase [Patescibacteria group bacterium]